MWAMATQCAIGLKEDPDILSICMTMTWVIGLFFSYTKIVVKGMTKAEMILKVGGNQEFHKTVFSQNTSGLPQSGKKVLKMKNNFQVREKSGNFIFSQENIE